MRSAALAAAILRGAWPWTRHVMRLVGEKHFGLIAAGVAFYGILSVFPGLAALIALWGVIGDPGLLLEQLPEIDVLLPEEVEGLIARQLGTLTAASGTTLGWASALSTALAIWSARAGTAALMQGLNAIYGFRARGSVMHYLRALALTGALLGVGLTALICVVVVPVVLAVFPLGGWGQIALELARWLLVTGVLLAGFALIYRLGPNANGGRLRVWPGAVFATVFWSAASAGFSIYLANFGAYNEVYGSIGAVIAMLMWLFISAWLVLLGGALNSWLAEHKQPAPGGQQRQGGSDQNRGRSDPHGTPVHGRKDVGVEPRSHGGSEHRAPK